MFLMLLAVLLISWCLSGCSAERPESQENGRAEPEEENVSSEAVLCDRKRFGKRTAAE